MPALDSIFNRSPNTPAQVDMDATLAAVSSPSTPSLLIGTSGEPSLWINVGTVGTLTVNGETFTDNGWTLLAQGNYVYQQLTDPTLSAVRAKLALPAGNGALQRLSQAFLRRLS